MPAIVVNERRVLSLRIVIDNSTIIKYFISGRIHWWVDENDKKIDLPSEQYQEMKEAVKNYLAAKKIT